MQKAGGRYVKFDNVDHTEGLMVAGVQSNDGKYMFAVVDRDRHVHCFLQAEHDLQVFMYLIISITVNQQLYMRW